MDTSPRTAQKSLLDLGGIPANLPTVELADNARQVLLKRYVRRNPDGTPAETVEAGDHIQHALQAGLILKRFSVVAGNHP